MSEPIVTDEEIEHEADSTVDRGLRGYIDAVTTGGSPNQADMEWTADTLAFARRIIALVRRRLAERLRSEDTDQTRTDIHVACLEAVARIVESDE